jgi:fructose-bisphosphate aldolase class II
MTLAPTRRLMEEATARGVGQGAFNVLHLETAEGLVAGAEEANLPVILQISQNCVRYHGCLEPVASATLSVARRASVPVAVHLDHAEDEDLVMEAVELGFGSVMFDGARLPYSENVAMTARVTRQAHERGVYVEAELGEIGGKDGAHSPGVRTDPGDAARFVEETAVDALAVAVGSSHAMTERTASLDLGLVADLHRSLKVPLVLHGSSGVPDEQIVAAIAAGMRKINISTHLNSLFTQGVRQALQRDPSLVDSRRYLAAGRAQLGSEVARMLSLFAGRRPEALVP